MNIKILLAEDHKILRAGIKNLLQNEKEIALIGEADNGIDALKMAMELKPDIVLMDIGMPGLNGIEATKQIYENTDSIKVIALSMHTEREYVIGMFKAGATGYLLKDCSYDELIEAINSVYDNKNYISREISDIFIQELLSEFSYDDLNQAIQLTKKEKELLGQIASGLSKEEITKKQKISLNLYDTSLKQIMVKLNIYSNSELIAYANNNGLN
jgi:DNA-binding NarL/FixJ family response regulator